MLLLLLYKQKKRRERLAAPENASRLAFLAVLILSPARGMARWNGTRTPQQAIKMARWNGTRTPHPAQPKPRAAGYETRRNPYAHGAPRPALPNTHHTPRRAAKQAALASPRPHPVSTTEPPARSPPDARLSLTAPRHGAGPSLPPCLPSRSHHLKNTPARCRCRPRQTPSPRASRACRSIAGGQGPRERSSKMLQLLMALAFSAAPLTLYVPPVRSLSLFVEAMEAVCRDCAPYSHGAVARFRLGLSRVLAGLARALR
jgi:hypothetical protein